MRPRFGWESQVGKKVARFVEGGALKCLEIIWSFSAIDHRLLLNVDYFFLSPNSQCGVVLSSKRDVSKIQTGKTDLNF